jgi:O-antigen ligase
MTRRPVLLVTTGTLFVIAASWFLAFMDTSKLDRIQTLDTGRIQMAVEYMGVIAERPILGMLQTTGASVLSDETVGTHPHNAYLETLYLGGIVYAGPMFVLAASSMLGAWRIWRARRAVAFDPLLTMLIVGLMFLVYAHGFVNGAIYYPTYAWAFFHVILSVTVLTLARDLRFAHAALAAPEYSEPEFDDSLAPAGHSAG